IMILGGSGLVGHAVARRLLAAGPSRIVLVALYARETEEAAAALAPFAQGTAIVAEHGDVYVPASLAKGDRAERLADPAARRLLVDAAFGDLAEEVLQRSYLVQLLERYRPAAVVDCINTATAFAYQDVYTSTKAPLAAADKAPVGADAIAQHALTMPI